MGNVIKIEFNFEDSIKKTGKYLVFDVETTGLPINYHAQPDDFGNWPHPIQIAWLLFDDEDKLIENQNFYIKQAVEIPQTAVAIHGITTSIMLEKGVSPLIVYANFKKAIENTEYLIAHNIDFDVPILHCDFLRNGMHWTVATKKMFCTMKTGSSFCKIGKQRRDGDYKWPTLSELYQKCFYPGHTINILSGSSVENNLHNANIDACMVAKCFFKLKEMDYLEKIDHLPFSHRKTPEKDNNNFESLHTINKTTDYNRYDEFIYVAEIQHLGLITSRIFKNKSEWWLHNEIDAQFKKWDEQWEEKSKKRKLQSEKELSLNMAIEQTQNAQEKLKEIENLLSYTFNIDDSVNWDSLKDIKEYEIPNPKNNMEQALRKLEKPNQPTYEELTEKPRQEFYEPKFSFLERIIKPLSEKKINKANILHQEVIKKWGIFCDEINLKNRNLRESYNNKMVGYEEKKEKLKKHYEKLEKEWMKSKEIYINNQLEYNKRIEILKDKYINRDPKSVIQYCELVLENSKYPDAFPKDFDLKYDFNRKIILVDYVLPNPDDLPKLKEVRYISSKKEMKEYFLSDSQISKNYEDVIYKITIRTIHEIFESDKVQAIDEITYNGWVHAVNKATGKKEKICIIAIQVNKEDFSRIELSNIDAKLCFKNLGGRSGKKLLNITPVKPISIPI